MAYPADKETFNRVINQNLTVGEQGSTLDEDDHNKPADFLERLEDTLGYGIKMGYTSMKAFFDWVVTAIGDAGDFKADGTVPMTGELDAPLKIQTPEINNTATGLVKINPTWPSKVQIGYAGTASGNASTAIGYGAVATVEGATAIGKSCEASGSSSLALGTNSKASGNGAIAIGPRLTAAGENTVAIGLDWTARTLSQTNTLAIMGGKVGIQNLTPSKELDVTGDIDLSGDIETTIATKGLIMTDRTTATRYRLKIDSGVLGIEAA